MRLVLLAAGGTGGHLFPAQALAHELGARGWTVHLATDARAERYAGDFPADEVHLIDSSSLAGANPLAMARFVWTMWRGGRQSMVVLNRHRPKVVVGFGGYPTVPPLWAALRRGVPTVIHEQNAVMGRANRLLARRVDAIAGGFLPEGHGAHASRIVTTGNPVRPAVLEAAAIPYREPDPAMPFRLLVFGGSQGAQFFSRALPEAIATLPPDRRARLEVSQQARPEDEAELVAHYARLGVVAEVAPFFTDLSQRMAVAHLVIARSGASTVSELAAIGRPALFVPFPHALDHDQAANAAAMAAAGGAEVHPQASLGDGRLGALIGGLMDDPSRLAAMAEGARRAGRPEAARLLADLTEAIASGIAVTDFRKGVRA